jgi:WD40 repeat protein
MVDRFSSRRAVVGVALTLAFTLPIAADSTLTRPVSNAGPVFGIGAGPGEQLLADAGQGIVRLRHLKTELVAALPGVTDVAVINPNLMYATTGGGPDPTSAKLWRINKGTVSLWADLGAFEATVNPDGAEINPNPFDVQPLPGGRALVADAGANALLIVDPDGHVDWVAKLPNQLVSTANIKQLFNCPAGPPNMCNLPAMIPAQPVTPSVAIGPDGAYYIGELKGFPAPTNASRVWRIDPTALHADCAVSPKCTVVANGFTSIIDIAFSPKGTMYVTELDEASWFAVEVVHRPVGGTVNECNWNDATNVWDCDVLAAGLEQPTGVAVDDTGRVYVTNRSLDAGIAEVLTIR